MQTGMIIDFYDDPTGIVLKQKLSADEVPDFIKTSSFIGSESHIPDDVYALVMVDQGRKMRKFACADKGNTALSVIYFMENYSKLPEEAQKVAAVNLVEACNQYGLAAPFGLMKIAGEGGQLYVDVTGKEAPIQMEKVSNQRFCLENKFPIDSYGQVQQAVDWFEKYASTLHPEQRREYCTSLVPRTEELGVKTSKDIQKYAGVGYASDGEVKIAVLTRKQMWRDGDSEQSLLDGLLEKRAQVLPEVFCEALRQFDEATGLSHYWDDAIYDPWYSTYGMEKLAEWKFETHGDRITEEQLTGLAKGSFQLFKEKFGSEMAEALSKNPTQIFDSLPLDSKRIIMRLANDPQPSPHLTLS